MTKTLHFTELREVVQESCFLAADQTRAGGRFVYARNLGTQAQRTLPDYSLPLETDLG